MATGTDHEVERLALLIDLRYHLAPHVHADKLGKLGQGDAIACQHLAAGHYLQFGALYLLLHVQVGYTLHVLYRLLNLVAQGKHAVQVRTEELDGYAGLRTAQHGIDAVADGLSYLHVGPHERAQLLAYLSGQLLPRAVPQGEGRLYLRGVHPQGMFVQFGTSRLAGYGLYLGDSEEELLGTPPYAVALLQGDAGQRTDIDGERPLIERRQEAVTQGEEPHQRSDEEGYGAAQHPMLVRKCPLQGCAVVALEEAGEAPLSPPKGGKRCG